ncbi:MAG TPA: benzoate-CoA ligase family protein [Candidatus Limnocylindria bacterium]|nr:benzoate-CoA ligase family protein [Candidatus Limnocylindria bacterium]
MAGALADAACAAGRGADTAIRYLGETYSYAALAERQDRAGGALRSLDVAPGDRVALIQADGPDFVATFLGALKIGAIPVPLSTFAQPEELAFMLRDCGARVAVVDADQLPAIGPDRLHAPALRAVVVTGPDLDARLVAAGPVHVPAATGPDDMCFWQYSSGTTGAPKAVIHLHRRALFPAEAHGRRVVGLRSDDRVYSVAKLFFSYGLNNSLVIPLAVGASVVLDAGRFVADAAWTVIGRERPTVLYAVPTAFAALLAAAESGGPADSASLRLCVSAGEALPGPLASRWMRRFGVPILDGIGSTEIGYIAVSNTLADIRPGSVGRPVPGYEAKVADADGAAVADGEAGTLWVRGGSTARAYHDRPERTAAAFRDDWVVTGDRFRVDDGHFFHLGRDDDMLKVAGQWVSPVEVEAAIAAHPAVLESAVVGRPDTDGLVKPLAYVVPKDPGSAGDALAGELAEFLATRLAGYKRPHWIELVPELPKTSTGKVQRYRLRDGAGTCS